MKPHGSEIQYRGGERHYGAENEGRGVESFDDSFVLGALFFFFLSEETSARNGLADQDGLGEPTVGPNRAEAVTLQYPKLTL